MSYILDALQRTETTDSAPSAIQPAGPAAKTLTLPWKLAIAAILLLNVVFVSLWLSGRAEPVAFPSSMGPQNSGGGSGPNTSANANQRGSQNDLAKRTLPGILSPKPTPIRTPAPTPAPTKGSEPDRSTQTSSQTIQSGTARTFRPSGARITIATPSREDATANSTTKTRESNRPAASKNAETVRLSRLSESAREALYVLTFSTHIYGSDADLRAVVVNGQRLTEGNSVTAGNGQEFVLQEITEDGVILQFEHDGKTEKVQIPAVMENWKDG